MSVSGRLHADGHKSTSVMKSVPSTSPFVAPPPGQFAITRIRKRLSVRRPDDSLRQRGRLDEAALRAVRVALLARPAVRDEEVLPRVVNAQAVVEPCPLGFVGGRGHRQLGARRVALRGLVVRRGSLLLARPGARIRADAASSVAGPNVPTPPHASQSFVSPRVPSSSVRRSGVVAVLCIRSRVVEPARRGSDRSASASRWRQTSRACSRSRPPCPARTATARPEVPATA